jgi:hypothetical protein
MGYTKVAKPIATWILLPLVYYLLEQAGGYLLLETGGRIVIGGDHPIINWTKVAKPAIP